MWSNFVARGELLRIAATLVEQDDRVEEAQALSRCVFNKDFSDEHRFRMHVGSILHLHPSEMDRIVARIRVKGARIRKHKSGSASAETKG
jgi:hypothetical protein